MEEQYITRPEFEQYSQRMDDENKRQNHRIDSVEKSVEKITDLTLAINDLTNQTNQMVTELKSMSERLEEIEKAPAENVKTVRAAVLSAIGTAIGVAIVAAILSFMM